MEKHQTAVAVYPTHDEAEKAVKSLTAAGFDMKHSASTIRAIASNSGAPVAPFGADSGGFSLEGFS
jgi:hypothetical protein